MEIEIIGKPKAEAMIYVEVFKDILGKEWDLEKAVRMSTKVMYIDDGVKPEKFIQLIYGSLDWTGIIDNLKFFNEEVIKVEMFRIKCRDLTVYDADIIVPTSNIIKLKERKFSDEDGLILKQSMIKSVEFAVRNYIINKVFNYSLDKRFEVVI